MTRIRTLVPATAVVGAAALTLGPVATALAQDDIVVTNRESVQAFLNSDGSLSEARVYDQIAAFGTGSVTIENPVSTDGLRNLDGFGGYSVEDGNMVLDLEVDGEDRFRTVSDFRDDLPVTVEPEYILNGEQVDAKDVVGKSGKLEVRYNITNATSRPTEVSYVTGAGDEVTATVDVPIPIVGIFETVLPPSFSAVESAQANVNGDGRGGTILKANVVLFPPLGAAETTIGYTTEITDGIVPEVQLDMTTVKPQEHYNFADGISSYSDVYDAGRDLGTGGVELDEGLGQLAEGAAELMGGLQLIADGTELLRAGLADEAAPGSVELADGAGDAETGASQLWAGLRDQLAPGARELAVGADEAASGADQLAEGARLLEAGMAQLAGGLPDAREGVGDLIAGVENVLLPGIEELGAGIEFFESEALAGVDDTVSDVHGGIDVLEAGVGGGIDQVLAGIARLRSCIDGDVSQCQSDDPPPSNLLGAVTQIRDGLAGQAVPGVESMREGAACIIVVVTDILENRTEGFSEECYGEDHELITAARPGIPVEIDLVTRTVLETLLENLVATDGPADETLLNGLNALLFALAIGSEDVPSALDALALVQGGIGDLAEGTEELADGLDVEFRGQISAGADLFRSEVSSGAEESKEKFSAGFGELSGGVGDMDEGVKGQLLGGLEELEVGLLDAVNGALELQDGAQQVADGNEELADGLGGQLAPGASELAGGVGEAADGAGELADGNQQIADGAGELADGIQDAADGSTELAEGAEEAAEGSEELAEGASDAQDGFSEGFVPGFDELAGGGGTNLAVALAATERGVNEGMPFGAPDDAIGTAAFSYTIAGSAGEGGQNLVRAVSAVVLIGLAAGGVAFLRRRSAV